MVLLELRGIHKSFPGVHVLAGVHLEVREREVHALVGANGAGKSTLIRILAGACPRDAGEILLDGKPVSIRTPHDALRLGIGVIYQELNLVPELTVAENLLLGQEPVCRVLGLPVLQRRALVAEAARHLAALQFPLDPLRKVRLLTTGEKQLVEIARALYRRARVLVLDEPTAALSRAEAARLFDLMRGLRERGLGLIYISHHLEEVFSIADRITVLRDGRDVATWNRDETDSGTLVRAMLGREVEHGARLHAAAGECVLAARSLSGPGFREVSLVLNRGEIVTLTGAAGAGQTELLWALAGAAPVHSGELRLHGRPVRWSTLRAARRAGVSLAPGDRKAYGIVPGLSVAVNLTFPELSRYTLPVRLLPPPTRPLRWNAVYAAATARVERYAVRCSTVRQAVGSLSGGNQQKVVVGRAAAQHAAVYLFDEPTRGVDVGAREELYALIQQLAAGGAAVLVATPDLQEALRLGHRVGVMRAGRLVYQRPAEEATEHDLLAALLGADPAEPVAPPDGATFAASGASGP